MPFLYMHSLYSNMIDKFNSHMSVSWSFYMQNNNGNLVVIKSGPHITSDTVNTMLGDDDDLFSDGACEGQMKRKREMSRPSRRKKKPVQVFTRTTQLLLLQKLHATSLRLCEGFLTHVLATSDETRSFDRVTELQSSVCSKPTDVSVVSADSPLQTSSGFHLVFQLQFPTNLTS